MKINIGVNKRIVVGAGLLLIGLVIFVSLVQGLREAATTSRWSTVMGTVLSSKVERQASYDDDDPEEFEGWLFTPRVTYRYKVNGALREGHELSLFEGSSSNEEWARRESGRFPPGSAVKVYYSPDGANAVLVPGAESSLWAWLLLPGAAMLVGTALLLTRGPRDRGTVRIHLWPS